MADSGRSRRGSGFCASVNERRVDKRTNEPHLWLVSLLKV